MTAHIKNMISITIPAGKDRYNVQRRLFFTKVIKKSQLNVFLI
jgi:hypothetical protein